MKPTKNAKDLLAENEDLRLRLEEALDTLRAIRSGEVDALVVSTPQGDQVFTLKGAEQPYRLLVETMSEGAVTVGRDGVILYCNRRFADLVKAPMETLVASSFLRFADAADAPRLEALLGQESGV